MLHLDVFLVHVKIWDDIIHGGAIVHMNHDRVQYFFILCNYSIYNYFDHVIFEHLGDMHRWIIGLSERVVGVDH